MHVGSWSRGMAAAVVAAVMTSVAHAEEPGRGAAVLSPQVIQQGVADAVTRQGADEGRIQMARQAGVPQQRSGSAGAGRRALWTIVGATGGFFGGAYLGASIENAVAPCGCDDPGLKGALIGMPIGAVAGGITAFLLSR